MSLLGIRRSKVALLSQRRFEPAEHPLRSVLDTRYAAMRTAMASGSADAIGVLLAPDFVSLDINRRAATADDMIRSVLALDIDRSKRKALTTLVAIETSGERATVLQHYLMTSDPDAPRSMPRMLQTLSLDTWRLADDVWLMERTETLEVEVLTSTGSHSYRKRIETGSIELKSR